MTRVRTSPSGKELDVTTPPILEEMLLITFDGHDNGNSGAACVINWENGQKQLLTLTANAAITFVDLPADQRANLLLELVQDGVGGRVPTFGANTDSEPNFPIATTAGAKNLLSLYWNGSRYSITPVPGLVSPAVCVSA